LPTFTTILWAKSHYFSRARFSCQPKIENI
jgi:hypothetical protein